MRKMIMAAFGWILLSGCGGGYWVQSVQSTAYTYPARTLLAEVYFDNTGPSRPYTELGMIEVEGEESTSNEALVRMLRQRAQSIGADAVIHIRKSTVEREDISIFDLFSDEEPDKYMAPVMSGVAIRYKEENLQESL